MMNFGTQLASMAKAPDAFAPLTLSWTWAYEFHSRKYLINSQLYNAMNSVVSRKQHKNAEYLQ